MVRSPTMNATKKTSRKRAEIDTHETVVERKT